MDLTRMERVVLRELVEKRVDGPDEKVTLDPDIEAHGEFEKALKNLERGAYITIVERFGGSRAVVRMTPRGQELWRTEVLDIDDDDRTLELDVVPTWPERGPTGTLVPYDDLEQGETFQDMHGRTWEVPRQVEDPDDVREQLNRTAIDPDRGTSALVPADTFVRVDP